MNQQANGGQFNFIGTYNLSAGKGNYIMIKGDDAGQTVADAVKFEYNGSMKSASFITSVKDEKVELNLYPNPANDVLNIEVPTSGLHQIRIITPDGRFVLQEQFHGETLRLNVEGLNQGLYIIKVKTGDNVKVNLVMIR